MSTVKEVINQVQLELGLAQSSTIVGSSDRLTLQFKALLERVCREIKGDYAWPELIRTQTYTMFATTLTGSIAQDATQITGLSSTSDLEVGFTVNASAWNSNTTTQGSNVRIVTIDSSTAVTVSRAADVAMTSGDIVFAQDRYSLPNDFDRQIFDTNWQTGNRWKMIGPVTAAEWELLKNGIVSTYPVKRFRVFGPQDAKFSVDAPPIMADNGSMFMFEYISSSVFRPMRWVAATSFAAGSYCSYNGNIYSTVNGGTTGSTAPTHISGSSSDGGVTWTYVTDGYEKILADTDLIVFDKDIVEPGLKYLWCKAKRLKYDDYENDFRKEIESHKSNLNGASTLNLAGQSYTRFLSLGNIPDSGYGAGYSS